MVSVAQEKPSGTETLPGVGGASRSSSAFTGTDGPQGDSAFPGVPTGRPADTHSPSHLFSHTHVHTPMHTGSHVPTHFRTLSHTLTRLQAVKITKVNVS